MDSAGIHSIGLYVNRRKKTIAERVSYQPVYALCTEVERILGTSQVVLWWDQDAVNEPEE